MDWSRAKSVVAGVGGLDVTFENDAGQLGAMRLPYGGQPAAQRQPTAWGKDTYVIQFIETSKHLTKPEGGPPKLGAISFIATKTEALNMAQGATAGPGYCVALMRLVKQLTKPYEAQTTPFQRVLVWTSCRYLVVDEQLFDV